MFLELGLGYMSSFTLWLGCCGLIELDTSMRDNIVNHGGVNYDAKTQLLAVPKRV
jgi:hypothetical protein